MKYPWTELQNDVLSFMHNVRKHYPGTLVTATIEIAHNQIYVHCRVLQTDGTEHTETINL